MSSNKVWCFLLVGRALVSVGEEVVVAVGCDTYVECELDTGRGKPGGCMGAFGARICVTGCWEKEKRAACNWRGRICCRETQASPQTFFFSPLIILRLR